METQNELEKPIGTIDQESTQLEAKEVKIVNVGIEETSKAKKVVFEVKHPDREENIKISSASHIVDEKIKNAGTWYSLDEEGNLQKGSALVSFLKSLAAPTIKDTIGRDAETVLNGKYLAFKAY